MKSSSAINNRSIFCTLRLWKALLFVTFTLALSECRADLMLDPSYTPKNVSEFLAPFFDADAVWPYGDSSLPEIRSLKSRWGGSMMFVYSGDTQFAWKYNGKTYFSITASFDRKDAISRENQDVEQLFLFNPDRTIAAAALIKVNKGNFIKGVPYIDVEAVGAASVVPDGMILIVGYVDSAKYLANPQGSIPSYRTAVLFRLSDDNGKLKIEQDDSCLGNPNKYKTIPAARTALLKCMKAQ